MDNVIPFAGSPTKVGEPKFFLHFLALVTFLHLIFFMQVSVKEFSKLYFALKNSNKVSLLIKVTMPADVNLHPVPKKVKKKTFNKKNKLEQRFQKTKLNKKHQEYQEVKKNNGVNTVLAEYIKKVRDTINKHKIYPKIAKRLKHQGRLKVEIRINKNGFIISRKYIKKTHSTILNHATDKIFSNIKTFGKVPKEIRALPLEVIIPISYELI